MEDDDLAVAREGGGEEGVVEDWRRDAGHARQLAEAHGEDLQIRVNGSWHLVTDRPTGALGMGAVQGAAGRRAHLGIRVVRVPRIAPSLRGRDRAAERRAAHQDVEDITWVADAAAVKAAVQLAVLVVGAVGVAVLVCLTCRPSEGGLTVTVGGALPALGIPCECRCWEHRAALSAFHASGAGGTGRLVPMSSAR
jgi:hypothetical protein